MFNFTRKTKKQANLYSNVILIIGILVAINLLAGFFFYRLDLTQNKNYTLSSSTKKILESLDDLVSIKIYLSRDLPPNLINLRQDISDVLAEYKNYGKNKIKIEYIDPQKDAATEQLVLRLGIPKLQFNVLQKEKIQVVNGYAGLAIFYADKKEAIPQLLDTKNLEYDLTSLIKKITSVKSEKVAFATGNDEIMPEQELKILNEALAQQYEVTQVDLSQKELVPEDIKTLILAGPTKTFSQEQKFVLDQFLMRGGSLLLAYSGVSVDQNLAPIKGDLGLTDQFSQYGIKLNNNLVLDAQSEIATFSTQFGPLFIQYPFWPQITRSGLNQTNPITNKLQAVVLPWTSSVEIAKDKVGQNEIVELVKSSKKSWQMTDNFDLNPEQQFAPTEQNEFLLGALIIGKFKSFFADQKPPEGFTSQLKESPDQARLAVVANSQFMRDGFIQRYQDNMIFFLNLVDSLTLSSDLISIRSKAVSSYPLKNLPDAKKTTYKFLGILGPALLVLVLALIKYILRTRKHYNV